MLVFFFVQAFVVNRLLYSLGYSVSSKATYKYTLIDYFFSQITPGASGGQPAEIYFMKKDGIALGDSSLTMLIFNGFYHLAVVFVVFLTGFGRIKEILGHSPVFYRLFVFGICVQVLLATSFFFLIFSKSLVYKLFNGIFKVLEFFNYKKLDAFKKKVSKVLDEYKEGAAWIKANKLAVLKLFPLVIIHLGLYYSMSYWILKAFGIKGIGYFQMIAYQGVFTMTFESLPLPGGVGLAEAGFLNIFTKIYPGEILPAAMLLTRGVSYYLFIIIGCLVTFFSKAQPVEKRLTSK